MKSRPRVTVGFQPGKDLCPGRSRIPGLDALFVASEVSIAGSDSERRHHGGLKELARRIGDG